jgi:hypothetical protein
LFSAARKTLNEIIWSLKIDRLNQALSLLSARISAPARTAWQLNLGKAFSKQMSEPTPASCSLNTTVLSPQLTLG